MPHKEVTPVESEDTDGNEPEDDELAHGQSGSEVDGSSHSGHVEGDGGPDVDEMPVD